MAFTRLLPAYAPTAHKEVSRVRQYITLTINAYEKNYLRLFDGGSHGLACRRICRQRKPRFMLFSTRTEPVPLP